MSALEFLMARLLVAAGLLPLARVAGADRRDRAVRWTCWVS